MPVTLCATKDEFEKALADAGTKAVVVDFTASWCGPCKMIGPKFEAMCGDFPNIVCLKVDVDENAEVAEKCNISAMPTFQVFREGKKVDELVGANEGKLREIMNTYK